MLNFFSRLLSRIFIWRCGFIVVFLIFLIFLANYRALLLSELVGNNLSVYGFSVRCGGIGEISGGVSTMRQGGICGAIGSGAVMSGGVMNITPGLNSVVGVMVTAKKDLSNAHCYPVPFKPALGHNKITFTNLTQTARIRIYTISGELVRTLDKNDHHKTIEWDVRNLHGLEVGSGVYLWVVESGVHKKRGKLMIIR